MASAEPLRPLDPSARNEAFQPVPAPITALALKKNETLQRPVIEPQKRALPPASNAAQAKAAPPVEPAKNASTPPPAAPPIVARERKLSPVNGRLAPLTAGAKRERPAAATAYQSALDSARTVTVHKDIATTSRAGAEEINGFVITHRDTGKQDDIPVVRAGSGEPPPKP